MNGWFYPPSSFVIANTFLATYAIKYSEIFFDIRKFLVYTPPLPPPQLYMLATALVSLIKIAASSENIECFREYFAVRYRSPDPSFF
jgi:hypothetical protein